MQYQVIYSAIWNAISGSIQQEVTMIDKLLTIWNAISGSIQQEVNHDW